MTSLDTMENMSQTQGEHTTEKPRPTVLIIEDEEALSDIYATKLRMSDMEVFTAENGLQGMSVAIEKKPDVILLDVMMPVKDGFETLQDLKLNPVTKDIPVMMLTNLGLEHEVRRGLRLGAVKFLTKAELTPDMVAETVCELVKSTDTEC